jgi:hypothetical protein
MIAGYGQQIRARDAEITYLEHQVAGLSKKLAEVHEDREKLQGQVRVAQEGAFRSMKKASWIPKEDRTVRDELSKLEERLRLWVKRYVVTEISALEHIPKAEKNTVVKGLVGYCVQEDWDSLVKRTTSIIAKRIPALFAQSMLAKDIFETIFASPFFAFPENDMDSAAPSAAKMSYLYEAMMRGKQRPLTP